MTRTTVTTMAALLMLGACGSSSSKNDGGASSGGFTTSLPSTKALNTLTPAEANALCMDVGKSLSGSTKQGSCKLAGFLVADVNASFDSSITDAQLKTMCMQAYSSCLTDPGSADAGAEMCMQPGATCTATIAEFSACLNDENAQLVATFARIPDCSAITRASLAQVDNDASTDPTPTMNTPACTTFMMKCPEGLMQP